MIYVRKLRGRYREDGDSQFATFTLGQHPLLDHEANASVMNGSIMKPVTAHDHKQLMYAMTSPPLNGQQVYNNIDD